MEWDPLLEPQPWPLGVLGKDGHTQLSLAHFGEVIFHSFSLGVYTYSRCGLLGNHVLNGSLSLQGP